MLKRLGLAEYLVLLLVASFPAAGSVAVSFPSQVYSDIGEPGPQADEVKAELARYTQELGTRYLRADERLRVEFIDVDLAGERVLVASAGRELRIARGMSDFPRLTIRYTLEGARPMRGEETISDPSYMWFPSRIRQSQKLYHEKRLLETWFRDRFAAP
jgi:hypothetical protein